MTTTLYNKGVYFERLTKNWLEREGYVVMRSAGSKTPNDLAVFPMHNCNDVGLSVIHPFVIQLKAVSADTVQQILQQLGRGLDAFVNQKFNNHYVDKYLFVYNIRQRKKIPMIFKWVINRWIIIQNPNEENNESIS